MPFTFRPSIGADIVIASGASGIANVDFYTENGSAISFTKILGFQHQYVPGGGIVGTAGSDTLIGTDQADIVFWDPSTVVQIINAVDFLTPLSNNAATSIDVVLLGGGNDILTLSHDANQPGNPGLYLRAMTADGGEGNDILWMAAGNDSVAGGSGDDLLGGQAGNDTIGGNSGTDTLFGGSGDDTLQAELTDFSQIVNPFEVTVWTGEGTNSSFVHSVGAGNSGIWSNDLYDGDADSDTIVLTSGNDILLMNNADLRIDGVGQADTGDHIVEIEVIAGGGGNDIIVVNDSEDGVAYAGALTISGGAAFDLIVSGGGSDLLAGGNLSGAMGGGDRDTIFGGAGNDTIFGESTLDAQTSSDGGFDTLYGGSGADTVFAGAANDTAFGENGQDSLFGGVGDDTLYGGIRVDTLIGDVGTDRLFGDDGEDVLLFSDDHEVVGAGGNDGVTFWTGEGPTISGTHVFTANVFGSFDTYDGGGGADELFGNNGNNVLLANGGDLFINGVAQPASAGHLAGIERFYMGGGSDAIVLNGSAGGGQAWTTDVAIFGGSLNDLIVSGSGADRLAGGNPGGDAAADAFDTDTIYGGGGNDVIFGDRENRELTLEGAADTLYGGSGDDTIFGDAGGDQLTGDGGADSLYGGLGNDLLFVNRDAVVSEEGGIPVYGWDGSNEVVEVIILDGTILTNDRFIGGGDIDTVDLRPVSAEGGRTYFGTTAGVPINTFLSGVEIIIAGAAADVINLTEIGGDPELAAYASNITIVAGASDDVVFSGNGSDLVIGDHAAGTLSNTDGDDTLFGGHGNDTIFGDSVTGVQDGARLGNDTIYGGAGDDTAFGGAGDDLIVDLSGGATLYGQDGTDVLGLRLTGVSATGSAYGGEESVDDGDDKVFVYGYYDSSTASLGAGNDLFIGMATEDNGEGFSGDQMDRVAGGTGDDVISTWDGDDALFGGDGNDVLWGGGSAGDVVGDTIYGGPGEDYIYPGAGDNDYSYGGTGQDLYYWARGDGAGDQIFDEHRGTANDEVADNYLVVYPGYDGNGEMPIGTGVFEADGTITDNDGDDMVYAYDVDGAGAGTIWRLEILQGEGQGSYVEFDQRDISTIALWNHEPAEGSSVITTYVWDGTSYVPG